MHRFLEFILGLQRGFLGREGEFNLTFDPKWPGQDAVGAVTWNVLLVMLAVALVFFVYNREARKRWQRIALGSLRLTLLLLVIALLNRPMITLGQSHTEPSILPVLVDDSLSMRIADMDAGGSKHSRLQAAIELFDGNSQALLRTMSQSHTLKFFRFDTSATPLNSEQPAPAASPATTQPMDSTAALASTLRQLKPVGQSTQIGDSIASVLDDLQGQRLAGLVLLTDGRDTPAKPLARTMTQLKEAGIRVFPVAIGSEQMPINLELQTATAQESAFKGDIVDVKGTVAGTGLAGPQEVTVRLLDKHTGAPLPGIDGNPSVTHVTLSGNQSADIELQFKPDQVGTQDMVVSVDRLPNETDFDDNVRTLQVSVLDAKISLLYVDGYPRWDYRYLKNEMIRDPTVDISCLLTSADPTFRQEGDKPITRFPESIDELMDYDVVLFGDVDSRQFSDAQLQMVAEWVSKKGGGFGMVAGPRFSPQTFRGTPIETILPVNIGQVVADDSHTTITEGFRPLLTAAGENSSIFRFFPDRVRNKQYLQNDMPPLYWYCRGITAKPGASETFAEHPGEMSADNHRAPLLVLGRFGAGRTLFSAIDDSWRWRLYTGESVFDTYWVQQLRYLARGRKLGQRRFALAMSQPAYQLGDVARATLRVLDPQLLGQFPDQIHATVLDDSGRAIRDAMFQRQPGQDDLYVFSAPADTLGAMTIQLPALPGDSKQLSVAYRVRVPDLELADASVDRATLAQLGQLSRDLPAESKRIGRASTPVIAYDSAVTDLPKLITSAAKVTLVETSQPLWNAPIVMMVFVVLLTSEWLLRKVFGLV